MYTNRPLKFNVVTKGPQNKKTAALFIYQNLKGFLPVFCVC